RGSLALRVSVLRRRDRRRLERLSAHPRLARSHSRAARMEASVRPHARSSAACPQMSGIHDLALFVAAGLLLHLTPGPDMAYIAARSAAGGLRDGLAATFGITAGCVVHTLAAALGLSALLATSSAAFAVVKWCGAAYLLYVGVRLVIGSMRAGDKSAH